MHKETIALETTFLNMYFFFLSENSYNFIFIFVKLFKKNKE